MTIPDRDRLDVRRSALLLFDPLVVHLAGPDRTIREEYRPAVASARRLLEAARAAGMLVAYAVASHRADGRTSAVPNTDTDNRLRPWGDRIPDRAPAVAAGTPGARVVDELAPRPEDLVVPKFRWSAFHGTYLDTALRANDIRTIVLVGGSTDIGIASTALAARDLDYELVIVEDACTATEPDTQDQLMRRVFPRMARVRSTASALAMIGSARA